jgi:hypothetical protein
MSQLIRFPFGAAETYNPAHATTLAVSVTDPGLNVINVAADNTAGSITMNLTNVATPVDGTQVVVKFPVGTGARNLVCGTNMSGPGIKGSPGRTYYATFVWQSDKYYQLSQSAQNGGDVQSPSHNATLAVTITDPYLTVLNIATHASAAVTLNLTISTTPIDGATLLIRFPVGGTARQLTPGTGMGGTVTNITATDKLFNWLCGKRINFILFRHQSKLTKNGRSFSYIAGKYIRVCVFRGPTGTGMPHCF